MRKIQKLIQKIKDYYIGALILILLALVATVFLIGDYLKKQKETVLFVEIVDADLDESMVEWLKTDIETKLGIDSETQQCILETSYAGGQNVSQEATVSAYMQTGQIDIVIAPEEKFNKYAAADYLVPIEDVTNQWKEIPQDLCFYTSLYDYSEAGAVTEIPFAPHDVVEGASCYGIYLMDEIPELKGYVIGLMKNSKHLDYAKLVFQDMAIK